MFYLPFNEQMKTTKFLTMGPYWANISIELKDKEPRPCPPSFPGFEKINKPVFSCSAVIRKGGQEIEAGQCRETIAELWETYALKDLDRPIINWAWEIYHLNDLHAWTPRQEARLKKNGIRNRAGDYSQVCRTLKKHHLFSDHGREFGRGWNYWEIPAQDLARIKTLIRDIEQENAKK